ncbi:MAG: hypothetical protein K6T85_02785, partial [Gorillibacterium sp.]|nr:hypothetical protein [Gorillibacterium sp.]
MVIDMKKFIIGLIAGMIIASTASVGAETISRIGKKIDASYKVTVDGKRLPNDAIVVEGKSYIPTTDIGAATGYDVVFVNKTEGISMKIILPSITDKYSLETIDSLIESTRNYQSTYQMKIDKYTPYIGTDPKYDSLPEEFEAYKKEVDQYE